MAYVQFLLSVFHNTQESIVKKNNWIPEESLQIQAPVKNWYEILFLYFQSLSWECHKFAYDENSHPH